jgi:hypothetical protein
MIDDVFLIADCRDQIAECRCISIADCRFQDFRLQIWVFWPGTTGDPENSRKLTLFHGTPKAKPGSLNQPSKFDTPIHLQSEIVESAICNQKTI